MKRILFPFFAFFILFSCKKAEVVEQEKTVDTVNVPVVEKETPVEMPADEADFKNDFDILRATSYRTWENENPATSLTKNWADLYEKNGRFYLGKADFKIENGYDECAGDSTKIINSATKTLLFIDLPELKSGEVKSLKMDRNKIWPNEKITLAFNGTEYILRGEGEVLASEKVINDDGKEELFQNVKNYRLYISTKNTPEKLLLQEPSFNDTFVELLFAGDIDRDGKLDFIFGANRDYEEERVILFLSSKAEPGSHVKKVAEIAIQFDC
ncbi:hypothetical protein [Flavobacterium lindanitolerans]|uniref:hypothetical protein n=1 Tax=Flavobacterium lindanitolerans TaxID=428988 RepID=UPI0027BAC529|nr:hypothetical protein [Flavobacterium lindanitolerans]